MKLNFRTVLAALGALIAVAVIAVGGRGMMLGTQHAPATATTGLPAIGGPFTLIDHDGRTVTDEAFRGKHMLIYFGYTFCPDVCPTSLNAMTQALDMLTPEQAEKIVPIFVSVDYERDTPEKLKDYVAMFHPRLIGMTGTAEQIADAAKSFRVYFAKVEQDGAPYLMDHSSIVYLMGPDGKFVSHFSHTTPPEQMAEGIRKAL